MKRRTRDGLAMISVMALVGLLVHVFIESDLSTSTIGAQVRARFEEAHSAQAHGLPKAPMPLSVQPVPSNERLAEMPCFGCHNLDRYLTETRFGHPQHAVAGHCHVCHAFESHFEVIVRKENCGECHKEE